MSRDGKEVFIEIFGRTDVGRLRDHNEDTFMVADLSARKRSLQPEVRRHRVGDKGTVFAVCDGMGGAAAGEVASQTAADTIYSELAAAREKPTLEMLARQVDSALAVANERIFNMARRDATRTGMGTTCSLAAVFEGQLLAAQIGDSRIYVIRGDQILQVTRDQSLLNQLLDTGQIEEKDIPNFEHSNVILQALGVVEQIKTVFTRVGLVRNDVILACSDGLAGPVSDEEMLEIVTSSITDLVGVCKKLTQKANEAGGPDNITVVLAQVRGAGLSTEEKEICAEPYDPPERSSGKKG